ncbi:MAG: aminotransferase class I/II-fold pyridoxal phosphate-dependent enzyme [Bacteroidetes bacterium]|nr:aminotransferase class I/II-fold pyridoxal phosphate-dependent enzyme [Bacteroidota bacterium]
MKTKKQKASSSTKGFATITSQDDFPLKNITPHVAPIFTSSTYVYESAEKAQKVFEGKEDAFIYSRWSHPNAELVEKKLEQLETFGLDITAKALVFSSGMAALSALFQSVLKPGDALLAQGNIYGTSVDYFNHYGKEYGIEVIYANFSDIKQLEEILKKNRKVKLMYIETPSNPTIRCYDLATLNTIAKKYGVKTAVDNTFASPYLQQPFKFGIDFILHSSTKYLNGHGTGLSGFVLGKDVSFIKKEVWKIRKLNGTICAPFDAWMLNVGLKTLSLRMEKHCANAQAVADFLLQHKAVSKVNYLGLKTDEGHALAKKQMRNFGGVLSFELKEGYKAGKKLMQKIKLCKLTASLGTIDTLIQHPASMSHYFVPKKQREAFGISDGLIRLSVGIEDAEDIIADLNQAL